MGYVVLGIIVVLAILLLPIFAWLKANQASKDVAELRAELLKLSLGETPATPSETFDRHSLPSSAAEPTKRAKPWTPPEVIDAPLDADETAGPVETPQQAAVADIQDTVKKTAPTPPFKQDTGPSFFDRAQANFMENWILWIAALSLGLGGLFIVQYSIEQGMFGPATRVIMATAFGAALIAGAEYLRRKPNMGLQGWFSVPVALAAGGVASLFGAAVSAHFVFDLTTPLVGFATMGLVCLIALFGGIIYGPIMAVIGIIGAYATPMLVSGGDASPVLYLYFLSVLGAALYVERIQKWIWLSAIAVTFTLLWGILLNADMPNEAYLPLYAAAVILMATHIPAFGLWPKWHTDQMVDENSIQALSQHYPTILSVATALGATLLIVATGLTSLVVWQTGLLVLLALTFWSVVWCKSTQNLDQNAAVFASGIVVSIGMLSGQFVRSDKSYADRAETLVDLFPFAGFLALATAVLFLLAAFWRTPRSVRPLYWIALGAGAPVLTYGGLYAKWHETGVYTEFQWTMLSILLAAVMAGSAVFMLRSRVRQRRTASDLFFVGAIGALSFAAYSYFDLRYLGMALAVLSLASLFLTIRFKYFWNNLGVMGLVALATLLLTAKVFVPFSQNEGVLFETFGLFAIFAALFAAGYYLSNQAKLAARVLLYETAFLLTVTLFGCGLIARWMLSLPNAQQYSLHLEVGLYATVWLLMACVQIRRIDGVGLLTRVRTGLTGLYSVIGFGALLVSIFNAPLLSSPIQSSILGIFPIDSVVFAFGLPALIVYFAHRFGLLAKVVNTPFNVHLMVMTFVTAISGFIALHEIRAFWHGKNVSFRHGVLTGELYSYTVILLVATVATVLLAISRKSPWLRKVGLGLTALTAAKVFLWDLAGMSGLPRATAFIILGLTLAGVSWLLQGTKDMSDTPDKDA